MVQSFFFVLKIVVPNFFSFIFEPLVMNILYQKKKREREKSECVIMMIVPVECHFYNFVFKTKLFHHGCNNHNRCSKKIIPKSNKKNKQTNQICFFIINKQKQKITSRLQYGIKILQNYIENKTSLMWKINFEIKNPKKNYKKNEITNKLSRKHKHTDTHNETFGTL